MSATAKRYYLIRTPQHRASHTPFTAHHGIRRTNKRRAIEVAKYEAWFYRTVTPVRNRRVSVYTVDPGRRPSLLWQGHADRKTGKIVSEVL